MPVSRHRAQRENSRQAYAESDSDGDTEREQTPRPPAARNLSKKRLSERFDPDGSFTLEDATNGPTKARPPLKSVNINDDVAEKRRRRKSARSPFLWNRRTSQKLGRPTPQTHMTVQTIRLKARGPPI